MTRKSLTLYFRSPDGSLQAVIPKSSDYSVMAAAKNAGVPGIGGDCGGNRACTTCHVYIASAWRGVVGPPGPDERAMLELTDDYRPESRLSCQIGLRAAIDGAEMSAVG